VRRSIPIRRVILAGLVLLGLAALPQSYQALAAGTGAPDRSGWTQVWDSTHTIALSIPPGWTAKPGAQGTSLVAGAPGGMPEVSVLAEQVGTSVTSEQYAAQKISVLQAGFPTAHVLPVSETVRLAGTDAHVVAFSRQSGKTLYGVQQAAVVTGSDGLVATMTWDYSVPADLTLSRAVLGTLTIAQTATTHAAAGPAPFGRRDLFAAPPGAVPAAVGGTGPSALLPPLPVPVAPGPAVAPSPLPDVPKAGSAPAVQAPPVELRGIALGDTPQAVLASGKTYTIVTVGQHTDWGTVSAITATAVMFRAETGTRILTFGAGGVNP